MDIRKHLDIYNAVFGEYPLVCIVRKEYLKTYELRQKLLTDLMATIDWHNWCGLTGGMMKTTWQDRIDFYAFMYPIDAMNFREAWGEPEDDPCDEWDMNYFLEEGNDDE